MKTGTFLCWLFGHKFVAKWWNDAPMDSITKHLDYCVRCGISKH